MAARGLALAQMALTRLGKGKNGVSQFGPVTGGLVALLLLLGPGSLAALAAGPRSPQVPQLIAAADTNDEATNVRVYEAASPSVVSIDAGKSTGSGAIVSADGLILTNAHVVREADTPITVILADGRKFVATVLGYAKDGEDLAALKIDGRDLPAIAIAPPGSVKVGQRAFAIGNPFGRFQGTFTVGIVSRIDLAEGLIQTDAAINPGNSGGPLLNSQGELIGTVTSIFTGRSGTNIGIGFAIAAEKIRPFLAAATAGNLARTTPTPASRRIALNGVPIEGELTTRSRQLRDDKSFYDLFTFDGQAGQTVSLKLSSPEFDAYLILLDPDGKAIAQNDDSDGTPTAAVRVVLPTTGTYQVIANTAEPGATGHYSLRAGLDSGAIAQPPPTTSRRSQPILERQGTLGPGSPVLRADGSRYNQFEFQGQAGQHITASVESSDFDTYLVLLAPNGEKLAESDDISDHNPNSAFEVTLPSNGVYQIIVNAFDRSGQGRYRLLVR